MWNRYVIAGPANDPARVAAASDPLAALRAIADADAPFVSRADESGTHERERVLWDQAGVDPDTARESWYIETGTGQAQTLLVAAERDAYALTDAATLLRLHASGRVPGLVAFGFEDERMRNDYAILIGRAAEGPARAFADWLTGPSGQAAIAAHRVDGHAVFHPAAQQEVRADG